MNFNKVYIDGNSLSHRTFEPFFPSLTLINPLLSIAHKSARIGKISLLKLEGIIKKISYERRDYESVDEKSLF